MKSLSGTGITKLKRKTNKQGEQILLAKAGTNYELTGEKTNYGGVTDAGAIFMYLYSFDAMEMVPLASPDIQPLNGVVHALNYNYVLGKI